MKHVPQGPVARQSHPVMGNTAIASDTHSADNSLAVSILKEVQHCIGTGNTLSLPNGIKPHLEALLEASQPEFYAAHEVAYWELYRETVELCRLGWHSFNYWVSLEQTTCYRLYWDLKRIADKYNKPLVITSHASQSLMKAWKHKGMRFLKQIAHFLHLHEFEYYRWIAPNKDLKKGETHSPESE